MKYFLIKFLISHFLIWVEGYFLVWEEHEMINKDLRCFFQCIFRMNRTIGLYFNYEFFIVGFLFNAVVLNWIFYIADWCKYCIDCNKTEFAVDRLIFFSRHITPSLADCKFNLELYIRLHSEQYEFRIKYFEAAQSIIEIACLKYFLAGNLDVYLFMINILNSSFETYLLEVQDYLGNILHNTRYGWELMVDAVNLYSSDGITFKRWEKDSSQCVSHSNTIARFKRAEFELSAFVVRFQHYYFIRLLEW